MLLSIEAISIHAVSVGPDEASATPLDEIAALGRAARARCSCATSRPASVYSTTT